MQEPVSESRRLHARCRLGSNQAIPQTCPGATTSPRFAALNVDRQLDQVQAAVVTAHQASLIAGKLIPIAKQQVTSAEEELRLTQKNLQVGTGLTSYRPKTPPTKPASATPLRSSATISLKSTCSQRSA
jgi:hypothetical protein